MLNQICGATPFVAYAKEEMNISSCVTADAASWADQKTFYQDWMTTKSARLSMPSAIGTKKMEPSPHEIIIQASDGEELAKLELSDEEFEITQEEAFRMYYTALILKACGTVDNAVDKIKANIDGIAHLSEGSWTDVEDMLAEISSAVGDLEIVLRHYRVKNPN